MLSRLVIAFLPMSKHLLISWMQSPSAVILEPTKVKSVTVSIVSPSICHEVVGLDAMILVLWLWIYFSSPNLVLLLLSLFLQLTSLVFSWNVYCHHCLVWDLGLTSQSPHSQESLICSWPIKHPIKGAAWTHDCLGKFTEITSFPICSWFSVPSLISLPPNFCFLYQIPYLPLLPCLGVTSKLGVISTAS